MIDGSGTKNASQKMPLIVGIGEVLIDVFEDGTETLGGAPLNVTFHLHQLLQLLKDGRARMISRVGSDHHGRSILAALEENYLDTEFVSIDPVKPTGTALVFTQAGNAGFEITPDVAWDYIPASPEFPDLASKAEAVVFGSLAQRSSVSRKTICDFVAQVSGERMYDVNLRRNTTNGVAGYSEAIVRSSLEMATILKLNDSELVEIASMLGLPLPELDGEDAQWALAEELRDRYDLSLIAVTRGPQGALVLNGRERYRLEDSCIPQDKIFPVGAGDSFAAGLLCGRVLHWKIEHCLELAEILAQWVVTHMSATPKLTAEMISRIQNLATKAQQETDMMTVAGVAQ